MSKFIILLLSYSLLLSLEEPPKFIKAYGSIDFGDSKQFVSSKLKENEIYKDIDNNLYYTYLFDTRFEIEFIYGTNERKPTFLKTIQLKLNSIVHSHIISKIIESFNEKYGPSKKYYISFDGGTRDYYKWVKEDKVIHLDFDGVDIDITINSKHFNKLSKSYIEVSV